MGDKIQYDDPKTMEETIRREKCLYEQQREKPTFQKAWDNQKRFKKEQRQKGSKPSFFRNSLWGQSSSKEPRKVEGTEQMPRPPPMECWGCKGNHRYRDCPHRKDKARTVHIVQQVETVEDMGSKMSRIYAALENKQAEFQSHMIEVEGMINNGPLVILIDSGASHSYVDPRVVESLHLTKRKHEKSWLVQLATGTKSDPGGYWWPPTFSDWLKIVFWQFWQFTIFSRFNFRGHFEGLNEGFLRSRCSMIAEGMIEPPK
jgi:hypothetical protein